MLSRGVGGHLRQLDGVGAWACRVHPEDLVRTKRETAEVGEPPNGNEEAVSILLVLRVSCDSRVDVLLLCGVAMAREKANGGELVDDMLPPRAG